jgi:hypothetical protein
MAFKVKAGKTKDIYLPVTPSTALSKDSIVTFTSGKLVAATAGTTLQNIVGVLVRAIVSTDTDYASDRLVAVRVPVEPNTVWEADVTSGLVAADVGLFVDLTDASTINRGASSIDVGYCVGVISSTKGLFNIGFKGNY